MRSEGIRVENCSLFAHPVLFSNIVNASFVDTLLSPETTRREMIAATVVPTTNHCLSMAYKRKN